MATTNAQTFTIGGVTHQVEDVGARQLIADLQAALNAITSGDTTTAIKTFSEIIAFLDNIEDSSTLQGIIAGLNTSIAGKYTKPGTGIPASDLAQAVQTILNDVANKANSADVYPKSQTYSKDEVDTALGGKLGVNDVSAQIPTTPDGTFTIHVGETDYTINLNHTHENMAKLVMCEESDLPSTLDPATIYAITDSGETEIEKLIIRGMEFAGGGGSADDGLPKMATPKDESTIDLGSIEEGETATKDITVRAKNLNYGGSTTGLTVEAVGTGLSLTYGQTTDASVTIPQADAMVGASLRITYSGSSSLNGELRFKQGSSVLASVVVVVVVVDYYSGIEYNKKAAVIASSGNVSEFISTDSTKCITPIYDLGGGNHVIKIRFGYTDQSIGLNGYDSSNNFIEQWNASANERTVNLYNNVTKVRATLQQADLDNCYIYDVTAAKWLFKGNNVTQIPS